MEAKFFILTTFQHNKVLYSQQWTAETAERLAESIITYIVKENENGRKVFEDGKYAPDDTGAIVYKNIFFDFLERLARTSQQGFIQWPYYKIYLKESGLKKAPSVELNNWHLLKTWLAKNDSAAATLLPEAEENLPLIKLWRHQKDTSAYAVSTAEADLAPWQSFPTVRNIEKERIGSRLMTKYCKAKTIRLYFLEGVPQFVLRRSTIDANCEWLINVSPDKLSVWETKEWLKVERS
jgi:hypothetical protein